MPSAREFLRLDVLWSLARFNRNIAKLRLGTTRPEDMPCRWMHRFQGTPKRPSAPNGQLRMGVLSETHAGKLEPNLSCQKARASLLPNPRARRGSVT